MRSFKDEKNRPFKGLLSYRSLFISALFTLSLIVFSAGIAWASSGGHHEPQISDLKPYYVNFGLYVLLMFFLLRKPAAKFWTTRISQMERAIRDCRARLEKAEVLASEAKKKSDAFDEHKRTLIEGVRQEGKKESSEIIKTASEQAKGMIRRCELLSAAEEKAAERLLQVEVGETVLQKAEEKLREEISYESDAALREAAVNSARTLRE